jgi:phosphohistidine swiveling domain-containing protein
MDKNLKLKKLFDVERIGFFPAYLMDLAATFSIKKILRVTVREMVIFYHGTNAESYGEAKTWQKICDLTQKKLIKEKSFYNSFQKGLIRECYNLERFSDKLLKLDILNLSDQQLIKIYDDFEKKTLDLRVYAWIPNFVDMGTKSIFNIAEEKIEKQIGLNSNIKEYVSKLTTPIESTKQREHELNLFKIQSLIKKNKIKNWKKDSFINKLIENHLNRYGWLAYYYIGPVWDKADIIKILENNLKLISDPDKKIKEIKNYAKDISQDKRELQNKLKLNASTLALLDRIAAMIFFKTYRKEFLIYSNYCFEGVLKEIAKRLDFSLMEVRFLTKLEIKKYLLNKNFLTAKIKKEIKNRLKIGCVSVAERDKISILSFKEEARYRKLIVKEKEAEKGIMSGNCAYPGKAQGIARIINLKEEVDKIKTGEILVSRATNPDLVVAMRRAAAFVTDEGGITCHAAIVAREMKKPCIIGTKIASKVIKDGDLLDVDAGKGIVTILKSK